MRTCNHLATTLVAACLAAACAGCWSGKTADKPGGARGKTLAGEEEGKDKAAKSRKTKAEEPRPKPTIPEVALTDEIRATCLVQKKGDTMPQAELPDLQGKTQATTALYGEKLTVMCFWTAGTTPAVQFMVADMLEFLGKDIAETYAEKGIRVIGVNVGDQAETAAQSLAKAGVKFPNLLDAQGTLFAKVATERLPRIYLLDPEGKVLWFDVLYSSSTQRLLKESIKAVLEET